MTEAPKRIGICPIHKTWHREPHETDWNYIRADLVEAAIKRALDAAVVAIRNNCFECGGTGSRDTGGSYPWGEPVFVPCNCGNEIRDLIPAQFIEEPKG